MSNSWKLDFSNHVLYHTKKSRFGSTAWNLSSGTICSLYIILSKLVGRTLNKTHFHNAEVLHNALENRNGRGLLTVCNHASRLDDPLMFSMLKFSQVLDLENFRWGTAAEDVCFCRPFHAFCMALGRMLPLYRGAGVYQKPMDFCINQLTAGKWVHIFPEGKIILEGMQPVRLKWGVGRLISEPASTPLVLLIHHIGFDSIFPNDSSVHPRIGNKATVCFSNPLDFTKEVDSLKKLQKSEEEIRKYLTDLIQEKMRALKQEAEGWHQQNLLSPTRDDHC